MESVALEIISNVGFPIAVSVALFYQMGKTNDMYLGLLRDFQEVINNNTKSIDLLNSTVEDLQNDMYNGEGDKSETKKS